MQPLFRLCTAFLGFILIISVASGAEIPLDPSMNQIRGIQVHNDPIQARLTITLEATRAIEYVPRTLSKKETGITDVFYLNIYRSYTMVQGGRNFEQKVDHSIVKRVRLNQYKLEPPMVRLVCDVTTPVEPEIRTVGQTGLQVIFPGSPVSTVDPVVESTEQTEEMPQKLPTEVSSLEIQPGRRDAASLAGRETIVLRLQHHPVISIESVIEPLLTPTGIVVSDEWSNSLILRDSPENLQDIRRVIEQLDQPRRRIRPLWNRARGIIRTIGVGDVTIDVKDGTEATFRLPTPVPTRLTRKLEACDPGDSVRIRWYQKGEERIIRSIRKVKHP